MRSLPPQLSFADLELQFQGVQLDPLLRTIAEFLDQHLTLIEQVRKDLERGLEERPHRTQRHRSLAGAPLAGSHARQELGLSRTARAHPRWFHATQLYRF